MSKTMLDRSILISSIKCSPEKLQICLFQSEAQALDPTML